MQRIIIPLAALCAATLVAQDPPKPVKPNEPRAPAAVPAVDIHQQVELKSVLGAKVRLKADPGDKPTDRPNGKVEDLLVETHDGYANWAIVSVGGLLGIGDKNVAVPFTALTHRMDGDDPIFELQATEAELKGLPEFKVKESTAASLQAAVATARESWRGLRPADAAKHAIDPAKDDKGVKEAAVGHDHTDLLLCASHLKGANVNAGDKKFGDVDSTAFDLGTNKVSFVLVDRGGVLGVGEKTYLVPLDALTVAVGTSNPKVILTLPKTEQEMEHAPKYVKPDKGIVGADNARAACEFFGVGKANKPVEPKPMGKAGK